MAIDITFGTVTNATTISDGTGYFDVLMKTINLHIEDQYNKSRLTGPDYATVYLGLVQAALTQSQQFALQEKLQEAQIDGILQDNILKTKQLEIAQKELDIKAYELTNMLPKQLEKLDEEVDLLQTQDNELQLNGAADREIKTSQKNLYNRQEQGFDDNLNLKLFEAQLDVYGMAWSSVGGFGTADDTALPDAFNGTNITALYNAIKPA